MGKNRAIGLNGNLLWRIPDDLKRFKKLTVNKSVIMGRKTYASIGEPLPERQNIVLTRNNQFAAHNCTICDSIESALNKADSDVFIIGGGEIYEQTLCLANRLYLTIVEEEPEADTFFPDYKNLFRIVSEENFSYGSLNYKFVELIK